MIREGIVRTLEIIAIAIIGLIIQLVPILVPATDTLNILIISCRSYQPDIRQINRTAMASIAS